MHIIMAVLLKGKKNKTLYKIIVLFFFNFQIMITNINYKLYLLKKYIIILL